MEREKQVRVHNLTKTFYKGTPNEKKVLNGLHLDIYKGDFISVLGGNGAGKSTFLNCLSGSLLMDSGSIHIGSEEVGYWKEEKRARLIGRVFQDPLQGTAPRMTVFENLSLALRRGKPRGLRKGTPAHERALFQEKLAVLELGLEERLDTPMGLLSGGQRQAIALVMAVLTKPDLLLLDEHTAALDPKTAHVIMELTDRLVQDQAISTLMITHNMQQALEYGNRLIMLARGEVVLDLSGKEKEALTIPDVLHYFQQFSFDDAQIRKKVSSATSL